MAKSNPIGVRFDTEIMEELGGSAQSVLIALESFYRISKGITKQKVHQIEAEKPAISDQKKEEPILKFKNDIERKFWEEKQKLKNK